MADRKPWFQLYNPAHKTSLIDLFKNARRMDCVQSLGNGNDTQLAVDRQFCDYGDEEYETETLDCVDHLETLRGAVVGLSCTNCDVTFSNLIEQRQHFKLDWHRHNIKRREHGQKAIGETEFAEIMDGLSSISGSDSEDEDNVGTSSQLSRIIEKVNINIGKSLEETVTRNEKGGGIKLFGRSPKVFFENDKNEVISMFQTALPPPKNSNDVALAEFDINAILSPSRKLGVVMVSGGHFAAAIFEGNKDVLHKTIHKYTVRAKQGGAQSRCDNKSGGSGPKSAGAGLRRHNELALTNEIQALLKAWEAEFNQCEWIFYRVGGSTQQVIFGTKSEVFQKGNPRIRSIPFPTKRPTFSEVKKVISQLTSVQVYQREEFLRRFSPSGSSPVKKSKESQAKSPEKHKKNIDRGRSRSPKRREEPGRLISSDEAIDSELDVEFALEECPTELNLRNELQEFDDSLRPHERKSTSRKRKPRSKNLEKVKIEPWGIAGEILQGLNAEVPGDATTLGKLDPLERLSEEQKSKLATGDLEALVTDVNQRVDEENSTLLHVTVKKNSLDLVWFLLEQGADPSLKDKSGKYPYNWSPSKECRNLFRRFRGKFPEKYDYQKAQIPGPLTDEMEQEIAEKKKIQNKLKREKEKQKRAEKQEKDEELEEQKRFLNLSDREKRALAADRRLLGQCKRTGEVKPVLLRCFDCGLDITGKVPFEYNQNKFCSTKCLATHRRKFPLLLSV